MPVSVDYRGSPNSWLAKHLTSGRLKLVEVRLSLSIKKCQGMAVSAFLSFLHVLMLKVLKQNVLLFFDECISQNKKYLSGHLLSGVRERREE